jgi:hypothetical protein
MLLAVPLIASPRVAVGQQGSGAVDGTVTAAGTGAALPFATVSVDSGGRPVFTDSAGVFHLRRLSAGRHRIRARELGYAAADTVVDVQPDAAPLNLTLSLTAVPHQLPQVAVRGRLSCRVPGFADSAVSPALATLATELKVNAERVELLSRELPYEYSIEAHVTTRSDYHPERDRDEVDTLEFTTTERHVYRPGDLIDSRFVGRRPVWGYEGPYIYLPELADLVVPSFQSHHCFGYGGVDTVEGRPELRVDFWPLASMHSADAEGSLYVDPERLVVLRSEIRMTRGEYEVPPIRDLEDRTWYREIVPYVVVEDSGRTTFRGGGAIWGGEVQEVEEHHVIGYKPLAAKKGKKQDPQDERCFVDQCWRVAIGELVGE